MFGKLVVSYSMHVEGNKNKMKNMKLGGNRRDDVDIPRRKQWGGELIPSFSG